MGCMLWALTRNRRVPLILAGSSFSFESAETVLAEYKARHGVERDVPSPYVPIERFPCFDEAECREHIKFYYELLHPGKSLTEDIDAICNEIQGGCVQAWRCALPHRGCVDHPGRPWFVYYLAASLVKHPSMPLQRLWDGVPPEQGANGQGKSCGRPGAKQALFSTIKRRLTDWLGTGNTSTARTELGQLLVVLAARYVFRSSSMGIYLPAAEASGPRPPHVVGLAYLEEAASGHQAYTLREPLALELAQYLNRELQLCVSHPSITAASWLPRLNRQKTGATVGGLRGLV